MRLAPTVLATLFVVVFASAPSMAQTSSHDEELAKLSAALRALLIRVEALAPRDAAGRVLLQQELFELSKRLHRLEEEAAGADLQLRQAGHPPNRQLLLSASISKSLDLAQSLTGHFLDTGDKIFWSTALAAAESARSLQAAR
jgi:hypothetical protein